VNNEFLADENDSNSIISELLADENDSNSIISVNTLRAIFCNLDKNNHDDLDYAMQYEHTGFLRKVGSSLDLTFLKQYCWEKDEKDLKYDYQYDHPMAGKMYVLPRTKKSRKRNINK
jgi:hypothetical protein